jgi:hypothetical protein
MKTAVGHLLPAAKTYDKLNSKGQQQDLLSRHSSTFINVKLLPDEIE